MGGLEDDRPVRNPARELVGQVEAVLGKGWKWERETNS